MSSVNVTSSLGLPPAPSIFLGASFGSELPAELAFLDLPGVENGPPPDPNALYCPANEKLFPFQNDGIDFLLENPVALLGDEMGLGKSIQAIAAMRLLLKLERVTRVLVLCPKTLIYDWFYKLRIWAPDLRAIPVEGPKRRREWFWRTPCHVNITGYETWREDLKAGFADPSAFDAVILDEIQRIKNPETAIHKAVAQLEARYRWGLSGTPLENKVEELLAIFAYLKPGLLPAVKGIDPRTVQRAVAPFVLRRRKQDVLEHLPPKESRTVWLELTPVQHMAYRAAERQAVYALSQAGRAAAPMMALALLNKLKQICNLDPDTGASCKMNWLEGELQRLKAEQCKALVFSQYPEKTLKPLLPRLQAFGAHIFDGSLSDWDRQLTVHRFQKTEHPWVLAMSLKAGGVGLTLTRANHVIHFDHWWNPAVAAQAEDRTHRIGQEKPVYVTTLLTRGTVEERIAELLERKRALFHEIMDPLTDMEASEELAVRKLSHEDLMNLFGISH